MDWSAWCRQGSAPKRDAFVNVNVRLDVAVL